jgi:hypothetical protein
MEHLQTMSLAQHKTLNDFYEEIVDLADEFAETYQGIFGVVYDYPDCGLPKGKAMVWINDLRQWLKNTRNASCQGETPLENIHDEIQALCAKTVYLLKQLDNPAMGPRTEEPGEYAKMAKW